MRGRVRSTSFVDCAFWDPHLPTFSECGNISSLLRMRKIVHSVSHTMRYECIFARCLLPRKRSCDVPIWVGKKDGAPLLYVKLSFPRLADGFNFNFEECFYPHVSQDLKKNKVMKDFDMRVHSYKFRMLAVWHFCFCCMLRVGFWGNKLWLSELMEPYFPSC